MLIFCTLFNFCKAAEQADAKAGAASEVEKKIDKSLAQELSDREKKELLAAQSILFRLKGKNVVDGSDIGPGLPEEIGAIICDEFVQEWNQEPTCMKVSMFGVNCAKILPDNKGIIYSNYNLIIARDGNKIRKLPGAGDSFEISPTKELLATFDGWRTTQMQIWNLEDFKNKQTFPVSRVGKARFFSDASKLATNSSPGHRIDVWDIETGRGGSTCVDNGLVAALTVSYDGQCIASGSHEANHRPNAHTIKIFDVRSGQITREMVTARNVTDLHFLPGDHELVSSELYNKGYIHRWDVGTGKKIMAFDHSSAQLLALTKDGTRMVSAGAIGPNPKNYAYLWNVQTGSLLQKFDMEDASSFQSCDISDDGSQLLAAAKSNIIKIWKKVDMKKELWQAHAAAVLRNTKSDKADGKEN